MSDQIKLTNAGVIQTELRAVEDATDLLMAGFGRLTTAIYMGRVETQVAAKAGQQAMTCLMQAQASVLAAREHVLHAHRACAREGKVILPEVAFGDGGNCPPITEPAGIAAVPSRLHAVA